MASCAKLLTTKSIVETSLQDTHGEIQKTETSAQDGTIFPGAVALMVRVRIHKDRMHRICRSLLFCVPDGAPVIRRRIVH